MPVVVTQRESKVLKIWEKMGKSSLFFTHKNKLLSERLARFIFARPF